jgi:uncharacterized membrane protein YccC
MPLKNPFTPVLLTHAVKSAIAGAAALYLAGLAMLPQGYWAAISALVVMGADVGETFKASRDRLIGTAVGAVTGGIFAFFGRRHLLWFALAVCVTALVCEALNLNQSLRLAGVTVAIIMLTGDTPSPVPTMIHRFLEVSLGIVVALSVSALPPRFPESSS